MLRVGLKIATLSKIFLSLWNKWIKRSYKTGSVILTENNQFVNPYIFYKIMLTRNNKAPFKSLKQYLNQNLLKIHKITLLSLSTMAKGIHCNLDIGKFVMHFRWQFCTRFQRKWVMPEKTKWQSLETTLGHQASIFKSLNIIWT